MGSSRYDPSAYAGYANATASMSHTDYKARKMKSDPDPRKSFDPKTIKVRESVKSDLNPNPTPIIAALDVTGSMGVCVEACRKGLGTLFEQILKRNPVSDPQVLAMGVGDMDYDSAPVQATQFESDPVTIGKQVEDLYLERGGGANGHESYLGPLYFALMRTSCDAFKDNRKGYLFTIGDEDPQVLLTKEQIDRFFGDQPKKDYTAEELIASVERNWHYFHIVVEEGSHFQHYGKEHVMGAWNKLLGQRVIPLSDHTKLAEVIISTIEITNGRDADDVAKSWDGSTNLVVKAAVSGLPSKGAGAATGPVTL